MSELDIQNWLSNITETVQTKDLTKHMDLVSKNVMVYGMPGGKILNYTDWKQRRENEFNRDLIRGINYSGLQIKNIGLLRLIFLIQEVMDGTNGDLVIINKQIVLEKEEDKQWRVVEETIKNWKYTKAHKTH